MKIRTHIATELDQHQKKDESGIGPSMALPSFEILTLSERSAVQRKTLSESKALDRF